MDGRHLLLLSLLFLLAGTTLHMCGARAIQASAVGVDNDYQHQFSIHKESSIFAGDRVHRRFLEDYGGRRGKLPSGNVPRPPSGNRPIPATKIRTK
ncbi:hypothetical protein MRB53_008374 [Persea americana]|uniref:Uncharacterized protein n=1 Tax=Persea americana TaxID=3435 RepID=A0ACC2MMI7_PERAE|nr:hypothetical protein MRB53_008374 [Persea americana]